MKTSLLLTLSFALLVGLPANALAQAESGSTSAVVGSLKGLHDLTANNIMQTASTLEEDIYAYRPTEEVRTTGEILAHIANAQFLFCSIAAGVDNPNDENYEETATSKADVISALESGFEFCSGIYDEMSDEAGAESTNIFGMEMTRSAVLAFNSSHNNEHYGNLVTYMRINGIVPPSSR